MYTSWHQKQVLLRGVIFATISAPKMHPGLEFESDDPLPIIDIYPSSIAKHS